MPGQGNARVRVGARETCRVRFNAVGTSIVRPGSVREGRGPLGEVASGPAGVRVGLGEPGHVLGRWSRSRLRDGWQWWRDVL